MLLLLLLFSANHCQQLPHHQDTLSRPASTWTTAAAAATEAKLLLLLKPTFVRLTDSRNLQLQIKLCVCLVAKLKDSQQDRQTGKELKAQQHISLHSSKSIANEEQTRTETAAAAVEPDKL